MNWRRGLFRVWIAFCVVWTIGLLAFWVVWINQFPQYFPDNSTFTDILVQFSPALLFPWVITGIVLGVRWIRRGFGSSSN